MASDLCVDKVQEKVPEPPKEQKKYGPEQVKGLALTSKNLKIVSAELIEVFNDRDTVGPSADIIRKDFFRHYEYFAYNFNRDFEESANNTLKVDKFKDKTYFFKGEIDKELIKDKEYKYVNFSISSPFDSKDVENNSIRGSKFEITQNYNSYLQNFENRLQDSKLTEDLIPNVYMYNQYIASLNDKDKSFFDKDYKKRLGVEQEGVLLVRNFDQFINKNRFGFDFYLDKWFSFVPQGAIEQKRKEKIYYITQDDIKEHNEVSNSLKKDLNYYVELRFPTNKEKIPFETGPSSLREVLKTTNLDYSFMPFVGKTVRAFEDERKEESDPNALLNTLEPPPETTIIEFDKDFSLESTIGDLFPKGEMYYVEKSYTGLGSTRKKETGDTRKRRNSRKNLLEKTQDLSYYLTWDMTKYFEKLSGHVSGSAGGIGSEEVFLGKTSENVQKFKDNKTYDFFLKLMNNLADKALKKMVEENRSSDPIEDYFNNLKETPREVLFYSVEKRDVQGNVISSFYIANPFEKQAEDAIKLIDNQVKYGKDYVYAVSAFCISLGKKYKYGETNGNLTLEINDYIPLVKVPLFTTTMAVVDKPPVPPSVHFLPKRGVDDRVKIKVTLEDLVYRASPIAITEKDTALFNKLVSVYEKDGDGKVLFSSDDLVEKVEVYRTSFPPASYSDFAGKKIREIKINENYISYCFDDLISTNKDYYYTFRSVDVHGNISNPTPVIHYVLKKDSEFLFPMIKPYEFKKEKSFSYFSEFQKYIQIKPSYDNLELPFESMEENGSVDELSLSDNQTASPMGENVPEPLWGKDFKLRITSKRSGKKVDVNFSFNKRNKKHSKQTN